MHRSAAVHAVCIGVALLVVTPALAEPDPPGTTLPNAETDFDPFEGIDRNGRIPRVELPPDLPNPDR